MGASNDEDTYMEDPFGEHEGTSRAQAAHDTHTMQASEQDPGTALDPTHTHTHTHEGTNQPLARKPVSHRKRKRPSLLVVDSEDEEDAPGMEGSMEPPRTHPTDSQGRHDAHNAASRMSVESHQSFSEVEETPQKHWEKPGPSSENSVFAFDTPGLVDGNQSKPQEPHDTAQMFDENTKSPGASQSP